MAFPRSPLHAICDADVCARAGWDLVEYASACLNGGALLLQIRAKSAAGRPFFDWVLAVVERAAPFGAAVIVNDRADVARLAGAAGVHVGQEDLTPADVRTILGDTACVGMSTHTPEQVAAAVVQPVDYMAIGPVFATATKSTGYDPVGLEAVADAAAQARRHQLPVVAIGGITLASAPDVLAAGAASVAIIGDLLSTGDPERRVREYLERLRQHA